MRFLFILQHISCLRCRMQNEKPVCFEGGGRVAWLSMKIIISCFLFYMGYLITFTRFVDDEMNNVLVLVDSLADWKPYSKTNSILTVSDYLKYKPQGKIVNWLLTWVTITVTIQKVIIAHCWHRHGGIK